MSGRGWENRYGTGETTRNSITFADPVRQNPCNELLSRSIIPSRIMKRLLTPVLFILLLPSCTSEPAGSEYANDVERIIWTLASDDMKGRQAFSPEAWEAARFIASEFEEIGLQTFDGDADYFQEIPLVTREVTSKEVSVGGVAVDEAALAVSLSSASINWDGSTELTRIVVGPADDLNAAFRQARGAGQVMVLVHPDLSEAFARYQRFLNRPSRAIAGSAPAAGGDLVMVLTSETDPSAVTVEASSSETASEITNVVGVLPGNRSDEFVVFSGHYDHIGTREGEEDNIFNGANDDASGTTAVIQLARHYAGMGIPERTLLFVAFTAEESGGYGSRYFSQQLDPEQIVAMFNIEMIGKPAVEGPNTAWITGFERSDFGTILQEAVEGTVFSFYPDPYPDQNLFFRSDNATLARLGVPAHTISTTPIDVDPDYHQVTDEVPTLNLEHLSNTIDAIAAGADLIVSGQRTPTRIDPSTVN